MFRSKNIGVNIFLPKKALETIFDECDRFAIDETGGRIVGRYRKKGNEYEVEVLGVIEPGPDARRTTVSFFQDGEYQEQIFRSLEERHPEIEHLGNWHTHHVNGLSTLSSGDKTTYQRVVNHDKHNTDFFYAILVVEKTPGKRLRYRTKHYFLHRNDPRIYEIPDRQVHITDQVTIWPIGNGKEESSLEKSARSLDAHYDGNQERVKDQELFSDVYPSLKPHLSKTAGAFYWRGKLDLVDGTSIDVLVMENQDPGKLSYTITIVGEKLSSLGSLAKYKDRTFKSARHAVLHLEKDINREIFLKSGPTR